MEEKLRNLRSAMDDTVLNGYHFSEEQKVKIRNTVKSPNKINRLEWFPKLLTVALFIGCFLFLADLSKKNIISPDGSSHLEQRKGSIPEVQKDPPGFVNEENWVVTSTFSIQLETPEGSSEALLKGIKGKAAFLDTEFVVGKKAKTRWFFWGKELKEVNKENFKLIGVHKETGEEKILVDSNGWEVTNPTYRETETKTVLGAQSSQHTVFFLPDAGLWRLDAYIGEKIYGSIVIKVKE